jgi:hypothetical protein
VSRRAGEAAAGRGAGAKTLLWEASPAWPNPEVDPKAIVSDSATGFGQAGLASHRADEIATWLWQQPSSVFQHPNGRYVAPSRREHLEQIVQ